jgi:hypothetical protein
MVTTALLVAANTSAGLHTTGVHNRFLVDSYPVLQRVTTTSRLNYNPDCFSFALQCERISDILALPAVDESFEELCNRRAMQIGIKQRDSGKQYVNLMWSGGIDSTVAVVSLLKTWQRQDLDTVRILLSSASIREAPEFYRNFILPNFRGRLLNSTVAPYSNFLKDSLLVTGELGDQLFGAELAKFAARIGGSNNRAVNRKDPAWKDMTIRIFSLLLSGNLDSARRLFALYEPIIDECPHSVDSVYTFFWWWTFTQKWQHAKFRIMLYMNEPVLADFTKSAIHFFDDPQLQRWAIQHPELKIRDTWETYKYPAKDLIVDYTGDREFHSKQKRGSLYKIGHFHEEKTLITAECKFASDANCYLAQHFDY